MIEMLLDTSSAHLLVSLLKDGKVLKSYKIENCEKHSTKLLETIDIVLKDNEISLSDIDTIYTVNGPGSFTGLRVGVTVAKMIGYTQKIKVKPISSLELMASTPFEGDFIASYIDARRGYVFGGIYDKNLTPILEDTYILVEDFKNSFPQGKGVTTSYTPVEKLPVDVFPKEDPVKVVLKHREDAVQNPHLINPKYLKRTEAEEKRNV